MNAVRGRMTDNRTILVLLGSALLLGAVLFLTRDRAGHRLPGGAAAQGAAGVAAPWPTQPVQVSPATQPVQV